MKNRWDERYSKEEFVYGITPNKFYAEEIEKLTPGKILFLGEGEGRNSVYAAEKGWSVDAYDYSSVAREKALRLAHTRGVEINYIVEDLDILSLTERIYDAAVLIFLHLPEELRLKTHQNVIKSLKPGGKVIIEAFEKEQIKNNSGGPRDLELLYSMEDLFSDFQNFDLLKLEKVNSLLDEGNLHKGSATTVRIIAQKPTK